MKKSSVKVISSIKNDIFKNEYKRSLILKKFKEKLLLNTTTTNIYSIYNEKLLTPCWTYNWNFDPRSYTGFNCTIKELGIRFSTDAHIASLVAYTNEIPTIENMKVRHLCKNKFCVNPNHLQLGTRKRDAIDVLLHRIVPKVSVSQFLLTKKQVKDIRHLYWVEGLDINEIKKVLKIGCTKANLQNIIKFKTWNIMDI